MRLAKQDWTITVLWIELNYTQCSSNSWEYIYNNYLAAHVQCMDRNKHVCHYNQHNCGIHFYLLISCSTTSWPPPKSTTVTVAWTSLSIVSLRSYSRNWPSNSIAAKPELRCKDNVHTQYHTYIDVVAVESIYTAVSTSQFPISIVCVCVCACAWAWQGCYCCMFKTVHTVIETPNTHTHTRLI